MYNMQRQMRRQRKMPQTKEREKFPGKELSKVDKMETTQIRESI